MKKTQEAKKSTTQTSTNSDQANHSKQQRYGLLAHTGIAAGAGQDEESGLMFCQGFDDKETGIQLVEGLYK
ncbi:MAG: hypothetical protein DRQ57_14605 [Gammaproteobacteria bacterium]|nr:MAG: hypothetical protein DRQ57_14605 [Gammaproteobacteria bacterium]